MLNRLTVRNFKSLHDVTVELPQLAVLLGPNALATLTQAGIPKGAAVIQCVDSHFHRGVDAPEAPMKFWEKEGHYSDREEKSPGGGS